MYYQITMSGELLTSMFQDGERSRYSIRNGLPPDVRLESFELTARNGIAANNFELEPLEPKYDLIIIFATEGNHPAEGYEGSKDSPYIVSPEFGTYNDNSKPGNPVIDLLKGIKVKR